MAREMVLDASRIRRQPFDLSHLAVGVKCGHSDTTSGIAGNPVVGNLFDRIVAAGGTAFFGETTEIIGAEHILAKRGINDEVSRQILEAADSLPISPEAYPRWKRSRWVPFTSQVQHRYRLCSNTGKDRKEKDCISWTTG